MAKLKNSIFPLEQENALHVYRGQELDVATSQQANQTLNIFLTLTIKMNILFT